MLSGEARAYHENLSRALASAYRLRPVTANIDPHLTIKAPFDALSTDMFDVETTVERFVRTQSPLTYTLKHFSNFDDRVVYMDVEAPDETSSFIQELKDELKQILWLEFKPHESDTKLHATLCYPKYGPKAEEIVNYLNERGGKEFTCTLDTIALLKKDDKRWEVFKEYKLGGSDLDPIV